MSTVAQLRAASGTALPAGAWFAAADAVDLRVLDHVVGPVLDVGCGPGRHVAALTERGVPALGIDISPVALVEARRRGAMTLERSMFDRVPGTGRWPTALLLDGNVGIGGVPGTVLARVRDLLAPAGRCLVETDAPDATARSTIVRLEHGAVAGPWFELAIVPAAALPPLVEDAGFTLDSQWCDGGRWFARLRRR